MSPPRAWGSRGPLARALWPLSQVYRALAALDRARYRWGWAPIHRPPVPVVVIGNWIVGGAGKTPTLLLVLELLAQWGWRAGVVSRGYGRQSEGVQLAHATSSAHDLGDEPLLIHRRSGVPLAVAERRAEAAQALLAAHPEVQVIVSDDGLQHHGLARDLSVLVFDARGLGNGWLLPAGPLRQDRDVPPLPGSAGTQLRLYTDGVASTPWPGHLAQRQLSAAWPLADWWSGRASGRRPLAALAQATQQATAGAGHWWAAAGLAQPERFFAMLSAAGIQATHLPLPDHAPFDPLPWPATATDVLVTEKDAIKLRPEALPPGQRVWVLPLDLQAPPEFELALGKALAALLGPPPGSPHGPPPR